MPPRRRRKSHKPLRQCPLKLRCANKCIFSSPIKRCSSILSSLPCNATLRGRLLLETFVLLITLQVNAVHSDLHAGSSLKYAQQARFPITCFPSTYLQSSTTTTTAIAFPSSRPLPSPRPSPRPRACRSRGRITSRFELGRLNFKEM